MLLQRNRPAAKAQRLHTTQQSQSRRASLEDANENGKKGIRCVATSDPNALSVKVKVIPLGETCEYKPFRYGHGEHTFECLRNHGTSIQEHESAKRQESGAGKT